MLCRQALKQRVFKSELWDQVIMQCAYWPTATTTRVENYSDNLKASKVRLGADGHNSAKLISYGWWRTFYSKRPLLSSNHSGFTGPAAALPSAHLLLTSDEINQRLDQYHEFIFMLPLCCFPLVLSFLFFTSHDNQIVSTAVSRVVFRNWAVITHVIIQQE